MGNRARTGHQDKSSDLHNKFSMLRAQLETLSDSKLLSKTQALNDRERKLGLTVLFHLREIDKRRLCLPLGYNSLFEFCTRHLGYSRVTAYRRIQGARSIGRFPEVAAMLLTGELNLSVVSLISGIITKENIKNILSRVSSKSYRDAEISIAMYKPIETKGRDRVKPVCVLEKKSASDIGTDSGTQGSGKSLNVETNPCNYNNDTTNEINLCPDVETDSSGEVGSFEKTVKIELKQKFKLEFMVDPEFMKKLERVKSRLSRKYPGGINFEMLFNIIMEEYLERHSPEKRIQKREKREANKQNIKTTPRSKQNRDSNKQRNHEQQNKLRHSTQETGNMNNKERSRNIPTAVRDKVYKRDGGRCAFVGENGKRCDSTWNLEVDHIVPFAKGGNNSPENLRLLCAKHNRLEAERTYGTDFMEKYYRKE